MIDRLEDTIIFEEYGTVAKKPDITQVQDKINEMIEQINKLEGTNVENDTSDFCKQVSYISGRKDESEAWKHKIKNKIKELEFEKIQTKTIQPSKQSYKYAIEVLEGILYGNSNE